MMATRVSDMLDQPVSLGDLVVVVDSKLFRAVTDVMMYRLGDGPCLMPVFGYGDPVVLSDGEQLGGMLRVSGVRAVREVGVEVGDIVVFRLGVWRVASATGGRTGVVNLDLLCNPGAGHGPLSILPEHEIVSVYGVGDRNYGKVLVVAL